ncbi:MAG: ParB N-terminal domain-containing protein, partial [Lentisphaeria bacterium]|nr:ParB N-terminal domain-containing protein [Lentisphaeria bacterium]
MDGPEKGTPGAGTPGHTTTDIHSLPLNGCVVKHVWAIRTPPENEVLYRPIRPDDPEIVRMAESIARDGLLQPLTVSGDDYVLDGNRRLCACRVAGIETVPCRVREDLYLGHPDFLRVLREFNRQRDKTPQERVREELVNIVPGLAYAGLREHRDRESREAILSDGVPIRAARGRCRISKAKRPFLEAVRVVLDELTEYLPVSDRQIHYRLLNDPPLVHASKPGSVYRNDPASYHALCDLLTRARLEGTIPFGAIVDATRPHQPWDTSANAAGYVAQAVNRFGRHYWRDLLQTQPNHTEIVAEKLTVESIVHRAAGKYTIPVTIARGFPSLDLRYRLWKRFHDGGRDRLVLLVLSDFDPEGMEIMHSLGASLRDEFDVVALHMVRVAITQEQIDELHLESSMEAKTTSRNFAKFEARHGRFAYELESIPPADLEAIIETAIRENLDMIRFS